MSIVLYQLPRSGPCRAVLMTAQHLGLKVTTKNLDLFAGDHFKPEFVKMNPQHCVPTIDDNGFYLWESRAIQTYLVNKYAPNSPLYPKDPKARAIVDRMLYFDIGTLYKTEADYLYPQLFDGQPADPEKGENFKKALALLEEFLGKTAYVAGDHLTIADYSILASLTYAEMNPQHTVPTLDDDGFYLWESRAIQTYLVNKYAPDSPLYPKDPKERAIVDRMLYFDIGTLYKAESEYLYPQMFKGEPADPEKEETFKKALGLLEQFLGKTAYVALDHMTLADFTILASLTFAEVADYSFESYPKISAWLQKMKSEVPNYRDINEDPLNIFKSLLKTKLKEHKEASR